MREILNMNFGWKYHYGDVDDKNFNCIHGNQIKNPQWLKSGNNGVSKWGYDDSDWKYVDLPHDFVVDRGEFSPEADPRQGCLVKGVVWYRKTFTIPKEDEGRCLSLEFDGVFRNCQVWLNGHYLGSNLGGYTSFSFDFSNVANYGGVNVVAVYVDAREFEGWWYEGGGIYRDVRLVKTDPLHIPQWGTFVHSDILKKSGQTTASVTIETAIVNEYDEEVNFKLYSRIIDKEGNLVAEVTTPAVLEAHEKIEIRQNVEVNNPILWSVDSPNLYQMESIIKKDEKVVDSYKTTFGIRRIEFDAERGFILNGKPLKLKGVCCHEDHAGVGVAVPKAVNEYRIKRLKEMGCNAYRTSHNPPTPAILDICDRLGILVMDETRLMDTSKEYLNQLESLIKRDRNHPCVILWSLGNEEMNIQGRPAGVRIMKHMQRIVKKLDPTRPTTYAMNGQWAKYTDFHEENGLHLDVQGFNYYMMRHWEEYDKFHEKYPDYPMLGSENGGALATRGLYSREKQEAELELSEQAERVGVWLNEKRKGITSAYAEAFPCWGATPEETWKAAADRSFVAGLFVWTGFDYRGETFPYEWPSVVSRYGIMDLCGFAKDSFYYYKSWWADEPVLHVFPHWNWQGHEGQVIDVRAYTNMDSVELFLNGESLGQKEVPVNGYVEWAVKYVPGKLTAVGYKNDKKSMVREIETTDKPAEIILTSDRTEIDADNEDVCIVNVSVVDEKGRFVPTADNEIRFSVSSNGKIIGVGNGNPVSHEHDKQPVRKLYHGLCQVLIQSTREAGDIILTAEGYGLKSAEFRITSKKVELKPYVESIEKELSDTSKQEAKDAADGGI